MKISKKMIIQSMQSLLIIFLLFFLRNTHQVIALALVLIVFSLYLLIKVKNDIYLMFIAIPIFYANYSIAIGEFINKNLQVTLNQIRFINYESYEDTLLMLTIFIVVFSIFIKPNNNRAIQINRDNTLIFYGLAIAVGIINIFFFDRSASDSYIVRSSSVHGYLYLLILFINYYSGTKLIRRIVILIITLITSAQALYFGNRGSIIPILIIVLLTMFHKKLNFKRIIGFTFAGVIILTIIGILRSISLSEFSILNLLESFKSNFFVQDTTVYAFNSSVTHTVAYDQFSIVEKLKSLIGFIASIFVGEGDNFTKYGNVTNVSKSIANNLGGGIISSHFYFWLGWFGVITCPLIISYIVNKLNFGNKDRHLLALISIVATTPTWYIYSPLQFFRIVIIFVPILYFFSTFIDRELKRIG